MKILTPAHLYELDNFEDRSKPGQRLQFVEKTPISPGSTVLVTINDGTTNEEVLAVLLDRLNGLQTAFPCRENAVAITHLETALLWLNHRTANRVKRGVEGKHVK